MELLLKRLKSDGDSTIGILFIDWEKECDTLEDEYREVKVPGETRIPAGIYEVGFMPHITPLTQKYRDRFDWFSRHIEIKGVPNFTGIYFHIGNFDEDTAGCILLGEHNEGKFTIKNSTITFYKFYKRVSKALINGEKVTITILDENQRIEDLTNK